jgi:nucleoid-associated protein YgaU
VVADSLGRPGSEREVARYWVVLVEANRDRLVDPTNPDLIYPNQVLRLPPA